MNTGYNQHDPIFPMYETPWTNPQGMEHDTVLIAESADTLDNNSLASSRAHAMAAVLGWAEEGDFSYGTLEEFVIGVCDMDGDFEITEDEEGLYNDTWQQIPNAFLSLGAKAEDIDAMVNKEDDDAAAIVGKDITTRLDGYEADDDEIIVAFSHNENAVYESADEEQRMVLEAAFKKAKVVRDGKVQIVRKRVSGKARMSAAQRAGLKKARRKANSAAGKLARKKSMRLRKQRGL